MKLIIGLLLVFLVAGAQCQQALTLENCVYDIGVVIADLSLVYRDRSNRQYITKARSDVQTLNDQCLTVLPANVNANNDCEVAKQNYKAAVKAKSTQAFALLQKYQSCQKVLVK